MVPRARCTGRLERAVNCQGPIQSVDPDSTAIEPDSGPLAASLRRPSAARPPAFDLHCSPGRASICLDCRRPARRTAGAGRHASPRRFLIGGAASFWMAPRHGSSEPPTAGAGLESAGRVASLRDLDERRSLPCAGPDWRDVRQVGELQRLLACWPGRAHLGQPQLSPRPLRTRHRRSPAADCEGQPFVRDYPRDPQSEELIERLLPVPLDAPASDDGRLGFASWVGERNGSRRSKAPF